MDGSTILNNVFTGIIAGVSAGLILSAFSYVKQRIDYKSERRDQIAYIRQILVDFQAKILSAEQVLSDPGAPTIDNMPDVHQLRWIHLEHTFAEVTRTLEGRAAHLSFDEKKQMLDAFSWYNLLRPGGRFGGRNSVLGEAQYHQLFDALEAIVWLRLKSIDRTPIGPRPQG